MEFGLSAAAPLVILDEDLTIVGWNPAAEELTGTTAEQAVGQPCWIVLGGRNDAGGQTCRQNCSCTRLARAGNGPKLQKMYILSAGGRRRVAVNTVALTGTARPLFFHLLRDSAVPVGPEHLQGNGRSVPHLTRRQLEVLLLLDEGASARTIAAKLWWLRRPCGATSTPSSKSSARTHS